MSTNENNNNDASTAIALGASIFGAVFFFLGLVLIFVALIAAAVLTVVCLFALRKPVRFGRWTITPLGARGFFMRGILGAVTVPAFVGFVYGLFDVPVDWDYLPHMMMIGYTAGTIGYEFLYRIGEAEAAAEAARAVVPEPEIQIIPAQPQKYLTAEQSRMPRYASWDDEEELR